MMKQAMKYNNSNRRSSIGFDEIKVAFFYLPLWQSIQRLAVVDEKHWIFLRLQSEWPHDTSYNSLDLNSKLNIKWDEQAFCRKRKCVEHITCKPCLDCHYMVDSKRFHIGFYDFQFGQVPAHTVPCLHHVPILTNFPANRFLSQSLCSVRHQRRANFLALFQNRNQNEKFH